MNKYLVTMECTTLNSVEVEAESEEEAKSIAENELRGMCSSDGMEHYEIEKLETVNNQDDD